MATGLQPPHFLATFNKCFLRFFYKSPNIFTPEQIRSIESMNMATIICQTGNNFHEIPRNAFLVDEAGSTAAPCSSVGAIDLRAWQESS